MYVCMFGYFEGLLSGEDWECHDGWMEGFIVCGMVWYGM